MINASVLFELLRAIKFFLALRTGVRFALCMSSFVINQIALGREASAARAALVRLLARVGAQVIFQGNLL